MSSHSPTVAFAALIGLLTTCTLVLAEPIIENLPVVEPSASNHGWGKLCVLAEQPKDFDRPAELKDCRDMPPGTQAYVVGVLLNMPNNVGIALQLCTKKACGIAFPEDWVCKKNCTITPDTSSH